MLRATHSCPLEKSCRIMHSACRLAGVMQRAVAWHRVYCGASLSAHAGLGHQPLASTGLGSVRHCARNPCLSLNTSSSGVGLAPWLHAPN